MSYTSLFISVVVWFLYDGLLICDRPYTKSILGYVDKYEEKRAVIVTSNALSDK